MGAIPQTEFGLQARLPHISLFRGPSLRSGFRRAAHTPRRRLNLQARLPHIFLARGPALALMISARSLVCRDALRLLVELWRGRLLSDLAAQFGFQRR